MRGIFPSAKVAGDHNKLSDPKKGRRRSTSDLPTTGKKYFADNTTTIRVTAAAVANSPGGALAAAAEATKVTV